MEFNRNHYLALGVIILLLGFQLRMVESYVLNEPVTRFVEARLNGGSSEGVAAALPAAGMGTRKVMRPPEWLGWCFVSVGSVLILHSLAMKKPGG